MHVGMGEHVVLVAHTLGVVPGLGEAQCQALADAAAGPGEQDAATGDAVQATTASEGALRRPWNTAPYRP